MTAAATATATALAQPAAPAVPPRLPVLLSLIGGYVDTAGFLALQGLFTAHVTGNFVTLGATLVLGTTGAAAKLLALPVFCAVVILTRWLGYALADRGRAPMALLFGGQTVLLIIGAGLAIALGPFSNSDDWPGLITGMVLVAAMAVQNAVQRIHLASAPPATLMTGTTTQIMIDLADLVRRLAPDHRRTVHNRLARMAANVAAFAGGCAAAALLFVLLGGWCFVVPPLLTGLILVRSSALLPARA